MSNNNNSIQPVKIGKFRRALRSIKRKLTPRRRNNRKSKNNISYIQPVKIGKFRKALRSIKRKLTRRKKNTRNRQMEQNSEVPLPPPEYSEILRYSNIPVSVGAPTDNDNLTNNEKRRANNYGIYPNSNITGLKYLNSKKFILSKRLERIHGLKKYKSRYQQLLNKNLGKRTRLNRVKRFIKRLSPRSREMKKHTQDEWDTTMGLTPNNDTNNQLYLMPQPNGTFTTRRKSQLPKSVLNKYGKFLEKFKIKNSSNI